MPERLFYFGTNFKMHQTPEVSARFYRDLAATVQPGDGVQRFMIPPVTSLAAVAAIARADDPDIWIGAQNMHWKDEGAFTGEISAPMLTALGADLVLLGHAERRRHALEQDAELNLKVLAGFRAGLRVLLCVGETAEERSYDVSEETVRRQLKIGLHGLEPADASRLLIGYEPVWSIGEGGTPASPEHVAPVVTAIRDCLRQVLGTAEEHVAVLYGGSVTPGNAAGFVTVPGIDGLFVGRSAWTVDGYHQTLQAGLRARNVGSRD